MTKFMPYKSRMVAAVMRKEAAKAGSGVGEFFKNRHVRSGLAGLTTAAIAKALGSSWGASALWGLGGATAAHFGQKAWDGYRQAEQQRKQQKHWEALSDKDKTAVYDQQIADIKNNATQTLANGSGNNNDLAKFYEYNRKQREAEVNKLKAMTPAQQAQHFKNKEAEETELDKLMEYADLEESEFDKDTKLLEEFSKHHNVSVEELMDNYGVSLRAAQEWKAYQDATAPARRQLARIEQALGKPKKRSFIFKGSDWNYLNPVAWYDALRAPSKEELERRELIETARKLRAELEAAKKRQRDNSQYYFAR